MNHLNRISSLILTSFIVIACGDTKTNVIDTGSTSAGGGATTITTGGEGGVTTSAGGDTGTGGDMGTGGESAGTGGAGGEGGAGGGGMTTSNCDVSVTASTFCVEDATGAPGDIVSVHVHALMPLNCGSVDGLGGPITLDDTYFLVANPVNSNAAQAGVNNCIAQSTQMGFDSIHMWRWSLGMEGNANCPNSLPPGIVTTLEIAIDLSTPPGQYPLGAEGEIYGWDPVGMTVHSDPPCGPGGPGAPTISGTLTVQ